MTAIVETYHLCKSYGRTIGVDDLNFQVYPGEIFGYLGPNGAGKTTTIRLLLDFIRPTSGSFQILGETDARRHVRIRHRVGNLPGEFGYYPNLSGRQFLDYMGGFHRNVPLQSKLCSAFHLAESVLSQKLKYYSKGTRQKIGLIQAMQHDPELLILDEPSEGLDPLMQQKLYDILLEMKSRGRTIIFSSHILPEVERISDRVAIIRDGQLQTIETIAELKKKQRRKLIVTAAPAVLETICQIPGLALEHQSDEVAIFGWQGPVKPILQRITEFDIIDLLAPEPQLEDIFRHYYLTD